jgi:hypothetical protein
VGFGYFALDFMLYVVKEFGDFLSYLARACRLNSRSP